MNKMINFKIDGKDVVAKQGETILQVARKNDNYIPTICYISKTTSCAFCRVCSVEVVGVEGFVLACNTPVTENIEVKTDSAKIELERRNIMRLYGLNYDSFSESDLHSISLAFNVEQEEFSANAWEPSCISSTCAHCSAGCALEYEVRYNAKESIYRVKNNDKLNSLCGAGLFGYDFENCASKDEEALKKAVEALKNANAIRFSSIITNEEAHILQLLKERLGIKLFNEDARLYGEFMAAYSSISGKLHHSASLDMVKEADAIIIIGTRLATDNPMACYAVGAAFQHNDAKIVYAHPMEDALMKNIATQFMKYEVGTEEGVMALLAHELLKNREIDEDTRAFLDDLDLGYLEAESNIGDDELQCIAKSLKKEQKHVLIIGSDIFAHKRAKNIAKLAALIEKYTEFSLLIVPTEVNSVGVSLTCRLDVDENIGNIVAYNAEGDFIMSSLNDADLAMPALNQVEGTVVNIDNRVLPLNAAIAFDGYTLNDVANALGIQKEKSSDYTKELETSKGFKAIAFDELENFCTNYGEDKRGYRLEKVSCNVDEQIEPIEELPEYNGTVIYNCNPVLQFNAFTNKIDRLEKDTSLRGSAQFAAAAKIADGDIVEINFASRTIQRVFKQDEELKGTIALNPTFDLGQEYGKYRFEKSKIVRAI